MLTHIFDQLAAAISSGQRIHRIVFTNGESVSEHGLTLDWQDGEKVADGEPQETSNLSSTLKGFSYG